MAKNKALSIATVISSDIGIDKDDLVAIKVAKVETDLINLQAEEDQNLRTLKKTLKDQHSKFEDALEATANKNVDAAAAVAALGQIGIVAKSSVGAQFNEKDSEIEITVRVTQPSDGYSQSTFSSSKTIKAPTAVVKANNAIEDTVLAIEETQMRLVDVRKRLSQIGTLERQAKAAMALKILEGSEEGKALLATLDDVKGLPEIK